MSLWGDAGDSKVPTSEKTSMFSDLDQRAALNVDEVLSELHESQQQLAQAQALAQLGSWDWDLRTQRVRWSDELYRIFGIEPGSIRITYTTYLELLDAEDRGRVRSAIEKILTDGTPINHRVRFTGKNGAVRYLRCLAHPFFDSNNNVVRIVGCCQDITEKIQAQIKLQDLNSKLEHRVSERTQLLAEANSRLSFLSEASQILSRSLEYDQIFANLSQVIVPRIADWCVVYTYDKEREELNVAHAMHTDPELLTWAKKFGENYPPHKKGPRGAYQVVQSHNSDIVPVIVDENLKHAAWDQTHLDVLRKLKLRSWMCVPLFSNNECVGAISFARSSSLRPFTQEDLHLAEELAGRASLALDNGRLYQQAQQVNELKNTFLAALSHELRSPLNAILGWSETLLSEDLPQSALKGVSTIHRNALTQSHLVNDLLDISRIASGRLSLDKEVVDANTLAMQLFSEFQPQAKKQNIAFSIFLDNKSPRMHCDIKRVRQILANLLTNAFKFTPSKGSVSLTVKSEKDQVNFSVKDTGKGIDPLFLPHVFERFRQEDAGTSRKYDGLGLGLAIVKELVQLHGGEVAVTSEGAARGSEFTFWLPERKSKSKRSIKAAMSTENIANPFPNLKILLVDDSEDSLAITKIRLEKLGAEVTPADSAKAGLNVFSNSNFDLIISDIGMPDMDGYEFIRRIRSAEEAGKLKVPAIALTGYARFDERRQALDAGFDEHVSKPLNLNQLKETTNRLQKRIASYRSQMKR